MPLLTSFAAASKFSGNIQPIFIPLISSNANVTSTNEGTTVAFELSTSPVRSAGNVIYWDIEPRIERTVILDTDFLSGNTGSVTLVAGGVATHVLEVSADGLAEGIERFRVRYRDGSITGPIIGYSNDVNIIDTSSNTNIQVFANTVTVNETTNNAVVFNVIAFGRNLPNTVYWTTSSATMASNSDFKDNVFSGTLTFTGTNSGLIGTDSTNIIAQANITRVINNDKIVEGNETFAIQIRDGALDGAVVCTSPTVTVTDTSNNNVLITANITTINETNQNAVEFTIIGNTRPNGNVVFWSIRNITGTVLNTDFHNDANTGSVTLLGSEDFTSNTLTLVMKADSVTDGNEAFQLEVRDGSSTGQLVGLGPTITVIDTSNTTLTVTPNVAVNSTVSEISNTVIQWDILSLGGRPAGNVVYWELINAATGSQMETGDFGNGTDGTATSGSIALSGVTAYATANVWKEIRDFRFITEGQERLALRVRDTSGSGTIVGLSGNVLINDTSNSQFFANSNTSTIAESSAWGTPSASGRISVTAYGRPSGNLVFWEVYAIAGTIAAADFITPISGNIRCTGLNNEYGWFGNVIDLVPNADNNYEGTEVCRVRFRDTSAAGPIFAETGNISITDNSGALNLAVDVIVVGGGAGGKNAGGGGGGTVFRTFPASTFYSGMVIPVSVGGGGGGRGGQFSPGGGGSSVVSIPSTYTPFPQVAINFPAPIVALGGGSSSGWPTRVVGDAPGGNGAGAVPPGMFSYNPGGNAAQPGLQPSPTAVPAFSVAPAGIGNNGQPAEANQVEAGGSSGGAPPATIGQATAGRPSTIYPAFFTSFGGGGAGATPTNRYDPGITTGGGGNSIITPWDPWSGGPQSPGIRQFGIAGTGGGGACAYHIGPGGFGEPGNVDFAQGGDGGPGVVIFRHPGPQKATAPGGTVVTVPGPATVYIFNGGGSMNFTQP